MFNLPLAASLSVQLGSFKSKWVWHDRARLSWVVSRPPSGGGSRSRTPPLTGRFPCSGDRLDHVHCDQGFTLSPVYTPRLAQRLPLSHAVLAVSFDGLTCHTPQSGIDGLPEEYLSCSPTIVRCRTRNGSMRRALASLSYF